MKLQSLLIGFAFASCCLLPTTAAEAQNRPTWQSSAATPTGTRPQPVTANLASATGTWTGVRSCDDPARARSAFFKAFDPWLGQQMRANARKRVGRFGYQLGSVKIENSTTNNARRCKAGFDRAIAFVEFY